MCAQYKLKLAYVTAPSDKPSRCQHQETLHPWLSKMCSVAIQIRLQGYKKIFMLNSAEHETFSANKYENANNSWHFHIY